jgi:hypothetical protein
MKHRSLAIIQQNGSSHTQIVLMYGPNSSFSHNAMLIELCPLYRAFVLIGLHNTSACYIMQGPVRSLMETLQNR